MTKYAEMPSPDANDGIRRKVKRDAPTPEIETRPTQKRYARTRPGLFMTKQHRGLLLLDRPLVVVISYIGCQTLNVALNGVGLDFSVS
jgi:hypothetical protein